MTHSWYGNGKLLAEALKEEFPNDTNVKIADIKDLSPEKVAEDVPDVIILGGAIRMFRADPKAKKWITALNKILKKSGNKIQYGTGFLTHALPTDKVNGYKKRYLEKIIKASMIENTYSDVLTARVQSEKGPIYPEEMEKAKGYIKDFIVWSKA
jgi:menaquinone-dependent protoporphyrinogen IX oxidase